MLKHETHQLSKGTCRGTDSRQVTEHAPLQRAALTAALPVTGGLDHTAHMTSVQRQQGIKSAALTFVLSMCQGRCNDFDVDANSLTVH